MHVNNDDATGTRDSFDFVVGDKGRVLCCAVFERAPGAPYADDLGGTSKGHELWGTVNTSLWHSQLISHGAKSVSGVEMTYHDADPPISWFVKMRVRLHSTSCKIHIPECPLI